MADLSALFLTPLIVAVFALAGVFLGSHLKSKTDNEKHRRELKISAFIKIVSLKLPITQTIQTNAEAQLLCWYYDARFHLTANNSDLEEAKAQNERMLSLIPEVSRLRSELSAAIAEVKIVFDIPKDMNDLLMEVYKAKSLTVPSVIGQFKTVSELDSWKKKNGELIVEIVKKDYADKIEALIVELNPKFDEL